MTWRGSDNQTIEWDAENRPVMVSANGSVIATFIYDGDGNRIKKTEAGETVLYINRYYEKNLTTENVTTSYYLGSRLIAQREGEVLGYIHQDHLSGTSLTTTDNGTIISSIKYFPYGGTRSGDVPTDIKFTGQKLDGTGLYYYNARYYDPLIGRFISADTIIPNPANPQHFNRYTYCFNNPLKYVDPTGHWGTVWEDDEGEQYTLDPRTGQVVKIGEVEGSYKKPGSSEPDLPIDESDPSEFIVVWGYADEIPTARVLFSYYHSTIIVYDKNYNYYRIETWGGGLSLGASIRTEIFKPGTRLYTWDGRWSGDLGVRMQFIDVEGFLEASTDSPYLSGGSNENFNVGLGLSFGFLFRRQAITEISLGEVFHDIPMWVYNAYKRKFGIDFKSYK